MKPTLEDKILLLFSDGRKHLQPYEIDAERTDKDIAIANLVSLGYVEASENASTMYDKYVVVMLTAEGKKRQKELLRLMNRNAADRCIDASKSVCRRLAPSVSRIIEGVIISLLSGAIGFWIGRITSQ